MMPAISGKSSSRPQGPDLAGLRVLIVDRHRASRDSLRLMLGQIGINKIQGVSSSAEVLRLAQNNTFDIILSDFLLDDGRDGQQLLEELRTQNLIASATVFIIVTSERAHQNVVGLAELAPDDYLVKPFTSEQLLGRLGRALHRKSELGRVLRHLDAGALDKALADCDGLIASGGDYVLDALRLKGRVLLQKGQAKAAGELYRQVLTMRPLPWASLGLAESLLALGDVTQATALLNNLTRDHRHFLPAHDLLAQALGQGGQLQEAQAALEAAAAISPHNTARQRAVGDAASNNGDWNTAERAYQEALKRARGSSLARIDDYANLARVLITTGKLPQAQSLAQELRRERRGDPASGFAAAAIDCLALGAKGDAAGARAALDQALAAQSTVGNQMSEKLIIDLAHASLANGDRERASTLLRQVIAEHPENSLLRAMVGQVFATAGDEAAGKALLAEVDAELAQIKRAGQLASQEGKLQEAAELYAQAAERMPNAPLLLDAARAIFTWLDHSGWQETWGERGMLCLMRAQHKSPKSSGLGSTQELLHQVAHKYGISVSALGQKIGEGLTASSPQDTRKPPER